MEYIEDNSAFAAICAQACQQPLVALDTEFVWTNTYRPLLGLIQLAWDAQHAVLIDPLAISDPRPFAALLASPTSLKVFHEAASDLPILCRWCHTLPAHVADTRIAAGFCGLTASLSLKKLIKEFLGLELAKTETRTDWLKRPLTEAQLAYATDDVACLPAVYGELARRMEAARTLLWFQEEMTVYEQPSFYQDPIPEAYWRRVAGHGSLSGRNLAVLQQLAAWRERTAINLDKARSRILKDNQMLLASKDLPHSKEELRRLPDFWQKNIDRFGDDILHVISDALKLPREAWPVQPTSSIPFPIMKKRLARLTSLVEKRAAAFGIDPSLIASRRDLEGLVMAANSRKWPIIHPLLSGWRRELLGDTLENIVSSNFES